MKRIFTILFLLVFTLGAFAAPEGWEVNTSNFEYSLTLTGIVKVSNTELSAEGDMLAAFVNGECRGVTTATYVEAYAKYYFFLTAFSNEYSGEELILKYYNKEQDSIYVGFSPLTFKDGDNHGSASEPYIIEDGVVNYNLMIATDSIAENLPAPSYIGQIKAYENDEEIDLNLALLSNSDAFTLRADSLFSAVAFNYEEQSEYNIKLVAYSNDSATVFEDSIRISIIDVYEAFEVGLTQNTIEENNELGATIGDFTTGANVKTIFSFTLDPLYNADIFSIENGSLVANEVFNYEEQSLYQIKVIAVNALNDTVKQNFQIEILNGNDTPANVALSNDTISENAPIGSFIGELSASDEDEDDVLTYSLVSNESSAMFAIKGDSLVTAAELDFETQPLHTLIIAATDMGGSQVTSTLSIKVQDVLDTKIANSEALSFNIYPNPATDNVSINCASEISRVEVYNAMGMLVYTTKDNTGTLNVTQLKQGVYFIKVFSQTNTGIQRLIKK